MHTRKRRLGHGSTLLQVVREGDRSHTPGGWQRIPSCMHSRMTLGMLRCCRFRKRTPRYNPRSRRSSGQPCTRRSRGRPARVRCKYSLRAFHWHRKPSFPHDPGTDTGRHHPGCTGLAELGRLARPHPGRPRSSCRRNPVSQRARSDGRDVARSRPRILDDLSRPVEPSELDCRCRGEIGLRTQMDEFLALRRKWGREIRGDSGLRGEALAHRRRRIAVALSVCSTNPGVCQDEPAHEDSHMIVGTRSEAFLVRFCSDD